MPEPKDMIVPMLREIRDEMRQGFAGVDRRLDRIEKRQEAQKDALTGETILARYAVREVDERLDALEREVAALKAAR